jgi:TRAP-type C4-dicarboxylate transport system substrate-binding protein
MTPAANEYARNFATKAIDEMVKAGVTVIEPSSDFDAKLRAAASVVADKFIKDYPDLKSLVDELQAAVAK